MFTLIKVCTFLMLIGMLHPTKTNHTRRANPILHQNDIVLELATTSSFPNSFIYNTKTIFFNTTNSSQGKQGNKMSSIGPQLPPQLTKRKHDEDDESTSSSNKHPRRDNDAAQPPRNQDEIDINGSDSDSEDDYGPPRPSTLPAAPASRSVGPSLPPHLAAAANNEDEINLSDSDSGPLPQPPPATAANPHPDSESSDDDDDFGPSLPSASAPRRQIGPSLPPQTSTTPPSETNGCSPHRPHHQPFPSATQRNSAPANSPPSLLPKHPLPPPAPRQYGQKHPRKSSSDYKTLFSDAHPRLPLPKLAVSQSCSGRSSCAMRHSRRISRLSEGRRCLRNIRVRRRRQGQGQLRGRRTKRMIRASGRLIGRRIWRWGAGSRRRRGRS